MSYAPERVQCRAAAQACNFYTIIPVGGERWWEDKGLAKERAAQFLMQSRSGMH